MHGLSQQSYHAFSRFLVGKFLRERRGWLFVWLTSRQLFAFEVEWSYMQELQEESGKESELVEPESQPPARQHQQLSPAGAKGRLQSCRTARAARANAASKQTLAAAAEIRGKDVMGAKGQQQSCGTWPGTAATATYIYIYIYSGTARDIKGAAVATPPSLHPP